MSYYVTSTRYCYMLGTFHNTKFFYELLEQNSQQSISFPILNPYPQAAFKRRLREKDWIL